MDKQISVVSGHIEGTPLVPPKKEFDILFKKHLTEDDWREYERAMRDFFKWRSGGGLDRVNKKINELQNKYVPTGEKDTFNEAVGNICEALAGIPSTLCDDKFFEASEDFKRLCEWIKSSEDITALKEALITMADYRRSELHTPKKSMIIRDYSALSEHPKYKEAINKLPDGVKLIENCDADGRVCEAIAYLGYLPIGFKYEGSILHIYISTSIMVPLGGFEDGQVRKSPSQICNLILKSEHKMDPYRFNMLIEEGIRAIRSEGHNSLNYEDIIGSRPILYSSNEDLKRAGMYLDVEEEFSLNYMAWKNGVRVLKPIAIIHDVDTGKKWLAEQLGVELEHQFRNVIKKYAETRSEDDWKDICRYIDSAFTVAITFAKLGYTSPDLKGRNVVIITDLFGNSRAFATDSFPQKHKKLTPFQRTIYETDPERAKKSFLPFGTTPELYPIGIFGDLYSCVNEYEEIDEEIKRKIFGVIDRKREELKKELEALAKNKQDA